MKKILITGGTGALGQKLVEILSLQNKFDIYFTHNGSNSGSKKEARVLSEKYQAHPIQVIGLNISLIPKNFDIVVNAVGFGAFGGLTHTVDDQLMKQALEIKSKNDKVLENCINNIPVEIKNLLNHPENYIGDAKEKSLEIIDKAKERILNFEF